MVTNVIIFDKVQNLNIDFDLIELNKKV